MATGRRGDASHANRIVRRTFDPAEMPRSGIRHAAATRSGAAEAGTIRTATCSTGSVYRSPAAPALRDPVPRTPAWPRGGFQRISTARTAR